MDIQAVEREEDFGLPKAVQEALGFATPVWELTFPGSADPRAVLQTGPCTRVVHSPTCLPGGSVGPAHIADVCVCAPGHRVLLGTRILDLSFPGCVVLGKSLTLSGPIFLIGKMSLGLAPDRKKNDFYYSMYSQVLGIC